MSTVKCIFWAEFPGTSHESINSILEEVEEAVDQIVFSAGGTLEDWDERVFGDEADTMLRFEEAEDEINA